MPYADRLRPLIIPTREIPTPGGGVGRRRCAGYQWPCAHDPADFPPATIHPTDCPPGYQVSLTQKHQYTGSDVVDCGSITVQTGCPSLQEGQVSLPYEYALDLGRL